MADDGNRTPPIDEKGYLYGVNVVDIGDLRVARGKTRREPSACSHKSVIYDESERRIWCRDCERDIEPFDGFIGLVRQFDDAWKQIIRERQSLEDIKTFQARSLAARELDKAWRKRNMVPACPSCGNGLLPEDFKNGIRSYVQRDYVKKHGITDG